MKISSCYELSDLSIRGGEWSFQKYGSRKILVTFMGSRSLDFCSDLSVSESRIFAR